MMKFRDVEKDTNYHINFNNVTHMQYGLDYIAVFFTSEKFVQFSGKVADDFKKAYEEYQNKN